MDRRFRSLAAVIATTATVSLAGISTTVAVAPDAESDFDGDGYSDLVMAVPTRDFVSILYGSSSGVSGTGSKTISSTTNGLVPTGGKHRLGAAFASGDFDADGFDDLAVTSQMDYDEEKSWSYVRVLYGSPAGLTTARNIVIAGGDDNQPRHGEEDLSFGDRLVVGRFSSSGYDDLAIAALGRIVVVPGSADGLTRGEKTELVPGEGGVPRLTVGLFTASDVDGSGNDDLVAWGGGGLVVVPGSTSGLDPRGSTEVATPEKIGNFMSEIAAGSFGNGDEGDVVYSYADDDGHYTVAMYGSAQGLSADGATVLRSDNDSGGRSYLASDLATGNVGYSSYDDLVLGVDTATVAGHRGAGEVLVIPGSSAGLAPVHQKVLTQNSPGISGAAEPEDAFGRALQVQQYGRGDTDDLAVAAPQEGVDGVYRAGGIHVIYGSGTGPAAPGNTFWSQNSPGVHGQAGYRALVGLAYSERIEYTH